MKKLLIFTLLLFFFISCENSPESKAKKLIEQELKSTMNDWGSYEFVEIEPLDSSFSTLSDNEEYHSLELEFKVIKAKGDYFLSEYKYDYMNSSLKDSCDMCIKEMDSITKRMSEIESSFVPEHNGWVTTFTCRGNNKLGNKVISKSIYYFDKDITQIKYYSNLD